jgi:hypothetical protein
LVFIDSTWVTLFPESLARIPATFCPNHLRAGAVDELVVEAGTTGETVAVPAVTPPIVAAKAAGILTARNTPAIAVANQILSLLPTGLPSV